MANALSEQTSSLWMRDDIDFPSTRLRRRQADVAVIGAGIAGLSTAYELATLGYKVVVLDRGPIAGGVTSRTTAHLAPVCDDGVATLIDARGVETAKLFQKSQEAAVNRIEALVGELSISCNFRRLPAYLFPAIGTSAGDARSELAKEYKAVKTVGVRASYVDEVPLPGLAPTRALRYEDQATFHPLRYLRGIAQALVEAGGSLHANTPVRSIEEEADGVHVGFGDDTLVAKHVVVCTNSPTIDRFALHTKMAPYRTYAMAFSLPKGSIEDALYWDMADPYHYVRLNPGPGNGDYLIAGGADHKTGEANDGAFRFEHIEAWIRQLVPQLGGEITRWSGQVLDTFDFCGFIGTNPGSDRIYVVTGDSGQGMTHGVTASLLIRDLIHAGHSDWQTVYDPSRVSFAGLKNALVENMTAVKKLAARLGPGEIQDSQTLKKGEGGLLRRGTEMLAISRNNAGKLQVLTATCTHSGCQVHWNATEQCWDCGCHGSHFAPDGSVLNGPAIAPLQKVVL